MQKKTLTPREFAHLLEDYYSHVEKSQDNELPLIERERHLNIARAGASFILLFTHDLAQHIQASIDKANISMQQVMESIQPDEQRNVE